MMWRMDEQVLAARRLPGWAEFHRQCGRNDLFFDRIERDGKRGPYKATAFTGVMRGDYFVTYHLADGTGKTPVDAVADAYAKAGRPVADAELAVLLNGPVQEINLDDILGADAPDDLEDILG